MDIATGLNAMGMNLFHGECFGSYRWML